MFGWPEVLISFLLALSHFVPRHYTSILAVGGLVLRARVLIVYFYSAMTTKVNHCHTVKQRNESKTETFHHFIIFKNYMIK